MTFTLTDAGDAPFAGKAPIIALRATACLHVDLAPEYWVTYRNPVWRLFPADPERPMPGPVLFDGPMSKQSVSTPATAAGGGGGIGRPLQGRVDSHVAAQLRHPSCHGGGG